MKKSVGVQFMDLLEQVGYSRNFLRPRNEVTDSKERDLHRAYSLGAALTANPQDPTWLAEREVIWENYFEVDGDFKSILNAAYALGRDCTITLTRECEQRQRAEEAERIMYRLDRERKAEARENERAIHHKTGVSNG